MSVKNSQENYLERKPFSIETTKEQIIYGGGETLKEVKDREEKSKQQALNEG